MIKQKKSYLNNTSKKIIFGFLFIIIISSFLLTLPLSSNNLIFTNPIDAIFTATSATCVTGLIVMDTYTYWNILGHFIILFMIQIGGLSFMLFFAFISLFLKRKINFREQLLIEDGIGLHSKNINIIIKKIFSFIIFLEIIGSFVLFINFLKDFNIINSFIKGIFHSISAFCNAGFDLMGEIFPYIGLSKYISNFILNFVLIFLIIIGGLGFTTLLDLNKNNNFNKLKLQTKMILLFSNLLIFLGTFTIFYFEYYNFKTFGNLKDINIKILASLFQSVTTRTAGFNTINQLFMNPITKLISILLMFIGGSPGSTAGGIKTIVMFTILLSCISFLKRKKNIVVFKEIINQQIIINSMIILIISVFLILISTILISVFDGISMKIALYESVSAIATVGLSMSLSPALSFKSKIIVILLMFIGRIGIITSFFGILSKNTSENEIIYPEAKILIG